MNNASNNGLNGISLWNSPNNNLTGNMAFNNTLNGIKLNGSH